MILGVTLKPLPVPPSFLARSGVWTHSLSVLALCASCAVPCHHRVHDSSMLQTRGAGRPPASSRPTRAGTRGATKTTCPASAPRRARRTGAGSSPPPWTSPAMLARTARAGVAGGELAATGGQCRPWRRGSWSRMARRGDRRLWAVARGSAVTARATMPAPTGLFQSTPLGRRNRPGRRPHRQSAG